METLTNIGSFVCLLAGSFLCISGGVGILKFPDFYTRMHAVGVTDTLATIMILVGLMLQIPDILVLIKLVIILLLTQLIGPTSSHALAQAAIRNKLKPELHENNEQVKPSNP